MSSTQLSDDSYTENKPTRLPMGPLLALATAAFITVLTETLPAGLLLGMSADLNVSESAVGQLVTLYALGTALTAVPLSAATVGWSRKNLLLVGVVGFVVGNTITAISSHYPLTMAARFIAGVAAGVVWSLLASYARRMAPENLQGKSIAIVMAGIPLALSLGVPAGTFLGKVVGWKLTFALMSALAVVLVGWIMAMVPNFPGQPRGSRMPIKRALTDPGVLAVLFVTLVFVLAHNILYTYIATFLERVGIADSIDVVLLVFGVASMLSIWIVGAQIDRRLRALTIGGTILVAVAATILAVLAQPVFVYIAAVLWGLGWGGVPTLLQTAVGNAGGEVGDTALAMLVTLWNAAMAGGGIVGGILLGSLGAAAFPWSVVALLVPVLIVVLAARTRGFPAGNTGTTA
ncbi:Predicted arabinose efflux permease, MFS family [Actinopolyspora alba]|uniref:Predicted arabinose efflux permease, MFS family n=1 Tax=Actinopolyspora alba TaxID=673379 RepID=A0A1I1VPU5_9ACTN|nr:MFS transporter [Actinopolyspora alba]SFD84839.1 Predicted arabinose efflux permease, MFS family [Actinopolyspora alba]